MVRTPSGREPGTRRGARGGARPPGAAGPSQLGGGWGFVDSASHLAIERVDATVARDASERSLRWLVRCRDAVTALGEPASGRPQALFPIVQGNVYDDLRRDHARQIRSMGGWDGYGIGGLSVGEAKPHMYRTLEVLDGELPTDRPRYLMGVGYPEDLLEAVARGCDLFDCVAPTRNGRRGSAWTLDQGEPSRTGSPRLAPY